MEVLLKAGRLVKLQKVVIFDDDTNEKKVELLLQAEEQERNNRRFDRLRTNARFRYQASIEELKLDPSRGVEKGLIMTLATGEYISKGEAVLITGATDCGLSFCVERI